MPAPSPNLELVPANAVRLIFEYDGDDLRLISQQPVRMVISLIDIAGEEQAGYFVDTRNAAGRTLMRVPIHEALTTSVEVFPEDHGEPITRVDVAHPRGAFTVVVPASDEADHVTVVRVAERRAEVTELGTFPLTK
jgi:hypothetical protein